MFPASPPSLRFESPEFRMAFARLVTHYFSNGSWLEDGILIRDARTLAGIPSVLVQGSLDLGNLLGTSWELNHAWPGSELVIIAKGSHRSGPGMKEAIVAATDRFASRQ